MAKLKRIIVAGPLVVEAIYPAPHPRDSVGTRQGKKALSSEAQRRMNLKYAWQKLELEIAANFGKGDIWATFTYDDKHLPANRETAQRRMKSFIGKLRKARRLQGREARVLYNIEHKHGEARWHHHVLINGTGADYALILALWGQGNVEFKRLRVDKEKNFETLARYMCKEERDKVGHRLWSGTRNLRKPERDCVRVDDDTPLKPPKDALVFADTGDVTTAYGHYRYIKYVGGAYAAAAAPRARRRRKKVAMA